MKVLVLGSGQIASAVLHSAPLCYEVSRLTRADLDIGDENSMVIALRQARADWIVNTAAYTAVDLAESHYDEATAVNDLAVESLARAAFEMGSRLLHLSTDFVFDGVANRAYLPSDQPNPLSVYGRTKLRGEHHVHAEGRPGIVLRTSWVYSNSGRNFVLTMLRMMGEGRQISVVCDQIGTPTWAASVAAAIWGLLAANARPAIYHWSDLGVASWFDFAVAIQEEALAKGKLQNSVPILPIQTDDYRTPAKRPAFSVLNSAGTRSLINVQTYHWRRNLRVMLDEL